MNSPEYPINDINNTTFYTSSVYAFAATGGFQMARHFDPSFREFQIVPVFDVTNSVQVMFDVATFNAKLGLIKNETNDGVEITSFNVIDDYFTDSEGNEISSINISSTDLQTGIDVNGKQVISVGRYTTLYSDFKRYVRTYFGFHGGFSSLFAAASEFNIDMSGAFNNVAFVRLLNGETQTASGEYINDLSGSITINNITKLLRFAIDANCFGNRTPASIDASGNEVGGSGTAVDPNFKSNYGMADGFVAGDLIWVPSGITIVLNLTVDSEAFSPVNNVGPAYSENYTETTTYTNVNFTQTTVATTNLINRTVKSPLLIKLVNASTIANL